MAFAGRLGPILAAVDAGSPQHLLALSRHARTPISRINLVG
jgi:hypothetical protein